MSSTNARPRPSLLGPFLLLLGLLWAGAAELGILSFRHALQFGLTLAASGLVVWGLHAIRAGRWRIFSLAILLAAGSFFAVQFNYLWADYKLAGLEPLRTLLPGHQDQLLVRILLTSVLLLASCLLGLFHGRFKPRGGSESKETKKRRRTQTAPTKASSLVRSLRR